MPDLYHNLVSGTITDNPLAIGATTINSAGFANLPAVVGPDTLRITLDPAGINGLPEIVLVTAHTAAATSITVTRAQETANGGNAAHAHILGTQWAHSATRAAWEELPYRKTAAKGDILAGTGAKATSAVTVGANTTRLVADSAQANGVRWAAETELNIIAAKGDLVSGTGDNTIAVLTVGANDTRLVADSSQASGLRYAPDTELKLIAAKGDLLVGTANDTLAVKTVGTDGALLQADSASAGGIKWSATAPTAYTPTVSWPGNTITTQSGFYLKTPGKLEIWVSFVETVGTATAALTITIPGGYTAVTHTGSLSAGVGFLGNLSNANTSYAMLVAAGGTTQIASVANVAGVVTTFIGYFSIPTLT